MSIVEFRQSIERHARYSLAQSWESLSPRQLFECASLAVRDVIVDRQLETERRYRQADTKHLYYLSIEYLLGRLLTNNLSNLGIYDLCRETLRQMGVSLDSIEEAERDAALGNGGLGRLAACFLDSLATLDMPGYGYGINYEYGLFRQEIDDGYQKEKPDNWLAFGTPWQIERPEEACLVPVYGRIEHGVDRSGRYNPMWLEWRLLVGVPHDVPVVGYGGRTVNILRLFSARSSRDFDMQIFNTGDYLKAVEQKIASETISKVLYPSDAVPPGQELRLLQEYFLVACAMRESSRGTGAITQTFDAFPAKVAVHLNDTHPALAIAELMRILVDERDLPWDTAWQITQSTMGYTNHTLLPEALEKWPVALARARRAAAPADHPRDQSALPGTGRFDLARRPRANAADVARRGSGDQTGAHGAPEHHRQPFDQRGFSAAQPPRSDDDCPRLLRSLARALQQQDERRHAAPLAGAGQSAPGPAHHEDDRRRVDHRPRTAQGAGAVRERRRIQPGVRLNQAR